MRELRARLLSQRHADERRLQRLGLEQTATMTSATVGQQVPAQVVAAIHARSDGIPLHTEEILAAVGQGVLIIPGSSEAVQTAAVPDTLGDAVLTRAGRLAEQSRQVAAAAAVIGRSFDFDLLTAVTGTSPDEVAAALRELQDAYLVLPSADAASFDFRHALIRDALYADTGLPLRRRLHERTARAAVSRGYPDSFVSAHFEHAANPELAYRHAVAAAAQSALLSAHREALELYRRAVRNQPPDLVSMPLAEQPCPQLAHRQPRVELITAVGPRDQDWLAGDAAGQVAEYLQAHLVSPVQVLQHDQQRAAGAAGRQQVGHVLNQQPATVVRVAGGGDRPHPRAQVLAQAAKRGSASRRQVRRQVQQKATERLRVARERRSAGYGEISHPGLSRDHPEQPGLADAGFTGDKHELATPGRGVVQAPGKQSEVGISANQDR